MKLTDALLGEHAVFYILFDQVEELAGVEGSMAQIRAATTVLAAIVESHAGLEEELLFQALEPFLGRDAGPLAVMRAEHEEIARLLWRIEEADQEHEAIVAVEAALAHCREHFGKEEQVLFPMALELLDEDTLLRLGQSWAASRAVHLP